jgi:NADPH2:quinone reductase
MKTIRVYEFGDPAVMKMEEVPDPTPGPGQILVKVEAIGVNPVETAIREGKYSVEPDLPYTPGTDAAGTVEALGDGVTGFKPGDRVYVIKTVGGAYAEKVVSPVDKVFPLPGNITFAQGAALGVPVATAYYGLFLRGKAVGAETLLVHGASGSVGLSAVQFAKAVGLTVFGTAGTEEGRALVKEHGVDGVFDHTAEGYLDEIKARTGGKGVDLILEMAADKNLAHDLGVLAKFGRVVVIGSHGPVEIDPRRTMGGTLGILGMTLMNATPEELKRIHAGIGAGLRDRTLRPVIAQKIPLSDAPRAHEAVMKSGTNGKIVLIP